MAEGFKFIHASDLHLDRPMQGLTELPAHLKPALTEAPYIAASRVFDQAIAELVDFVLLSGDPFDHPSAPPRAKTFLLSQFKRLADRQITIYWSSGDASQPSSWPTAAELPENVVRFSCNDVEVVTHSKEGVPVATIHGACCDSRRENFSPFFADDGEPFPIAISTGEIEAGPTENSNIRYWALGGQPVTTLLETEHGMASHPGTPQGRSIFENGPCGCLLGRVTSKGELHLNKIETGPVRWLHQKVTISEDVSDDKLKDIFSERAMSIANGTSGGNTLVQWHILTTGELNLNLRRIERRKELVDWLHAEFGSETENWLWTTDVLIEPPDSLPQEWYEEDTILGEYLRAIEHYQKEESAEVSLHHYLPSTTENGSFFDIGVIASQNRREILRQTVMLGVDYMGPSVTNGDRGPTKLETP